MKTLSLRLLLAASAVIPLSLTTPARADLIRAVDFSGGVRAPTPTTFALGFQFTVGSLPFEVTAVGLRAGTTLSGDTVRIYENGTTTNTLLQAISVSDPLSGDGLYNVVDLATPVLLLANTTYNFVVDHLAGDSALLLAAISFVDPALTFGSAIGDSHLASAFPTADNVNLGAYAGGTFQGRTVAPTAVPEPAPLLLLGSALTGLCVTLRLRRPEA